MKYPTKQQILESKPQFSDEEWSEIKNKVLVWKKVFYDYSQYKKSSEYGKTLSIYILLQELIKLRKINVCINVISDHFSYNPKLKMINLSHFEPSIISSLHELGHAIHGPSELDACVFSVHLFKDCFPREYKKLIWDNHMLKLPT